PSVQGLNGSALFMKTNSTAKIYANFTFPVPNNRTWSLSPGIYVTINGPPVTIDPRNMTIVVEPNSFTGNKNNATVTYTITAKNNTKGVYAAFLYFCGLSPLVVGLNESEVNPTVFEKYFTASYNCPAMYEDSPEMKIVGYSGMISKTIQINVNNASNLSSEHGTQDKIQTNTILLPLLFGIPVAVLCAVVVLKSGKK
ncbi:MAG: hypothetical protein ACRDFB_01365, partial [Rhabdochlamydiaceae bacterium]